MRYWKKNPPVHQLVAAYMGIKPEEEKGSPDELFGMLLGGAR
mgnify:FL=1